jgi:hypothetical protein
MNILDRANDRFKHLNLLTIKLLNEKKTSHFTRGTNFKPEQKNRHGIVPVYL